MKINSWLVFLAAVIGVNFLSWQSNLFYPFSDKYWSVIIFSILSFSFGYLFGGRIFLAFGGMRLFLLISKIGMTEKKSYLLYVLFFWIFIFLNIIDRFLMMGPTFLYPEMVMQYRIIMTEEGGSNVIRGLSIGNFFIFLMPAYICARRKFFSLLTMIACSLAFIIYIYMSSARSSLFMSVLIVFYFWLIPKNININMIFKIIFIFCFLILGFSIIGVIVGKSTDELGFLVYAAAPLHAFDELLNDPELLSNYFLSFFPIHNLLAIFFSIDPALKLPNVFTPLPTNVYTMFGVYFVDYGQIGLLLILCIIGSVSSAIDKAYRKKSIEIFRIWGAINMMILTLSIFYDYYTTSGIVWMSIILSVFFFSAKEDVKFVKN